MSRHCTKIRQYATLLEQRSRFIFNCLRDPGSKLRQPHSKVAGEPPRPAPEEYYFNHDLRDANLQAATRWCPRRDRQERRGRNQFQCVRRGNVSGYTNQPASARNPKSAFRPEHVNGLASRSRAYHFRLSRSFSVDLSSADSARNSLSIAFSALSSLSILVSGTVIWAYYSRGHFNSDFANVSVKLLIPRQAC